MAQKRSYEETTEEPSKLPRLDSTNDPEYLLPIEFARNGASPCVTQVAARLFSIGLKKCLFECLIVIGEAENHKNSSGNMFVPNFQEALSGLLRLVERYCPTGSVTAVTRDHKSMRNVLHHEIVHCRVEYALASNPIWWKYFEVKDFQGTESPPKLRAPLQTVEWMSRVLEKHFSEGLPLGVAKCINSRYSHAIIHEGTSIPPGAVVEVHQLPWTATPYSIAAFFRGLNIRPGGIAIKITEGRRSNTAYVAFESDYEAQLACERTTLEDFAVLASLEAPVANQSVRTTGVQIAMASEVLFLQYATCRFPEIATFLGQLTDECETVVRIRGLPYSTKKPDLIKFFDQVDAKILNGEKGIFFATHADCRPTGDAFVLFVSNADADRALSRHRNYLGQRYVELFKASPSEAVQVCQGAQRNGLSVGKNIGLMNKLLRSQSTTLTPNEPLPPLPFISPIPLSTPTLTNGMMLPPDLSSNSLNPLLLQAPPLCSLPLSNALSSLNELNDPTDPKCPFPKPLPSGGARFVLQVVDLPASFSRQNMRLFIGLEVFAKIYRMCKITTCLTDASWLLLFADLSDVIWALEELIRRPSSLSPRFFVFEVNPQDFQMNLLPASRLPSSLPALRVLNMQLPLDATARRSVPQMPALSRTEPPQSRNVASLVAPQPMRQPALGMSWETNQSPLPDVGGSCVLVVTGLPRNVTQQELLSLYAPVMQVLSSPPQFVPLPSSSQEVFVTYLAVFASQLDALIVITHCRYSSLRGNIFIVITNPVGQQLTTPSVPMIPNLAGLMQTNKTV